VSTNPTSFRMPFQTQIANLPPEHQLMIRTIFNQLDDHLNAISVLKSQIESNKSAIASTSTIVNNISSASETVSEQVVPETIGFVNDQTGNTSYTTNQTDYGNIIILDDASPIAVTLSTTGSVPGIILPFFCAFLNLGAGTATLTPDAGNINNTTSETLADGQFAIVYYDGTNTWCQIATNNAGTITDVVAGTGLTGGGSSGSVTLAIAATSVIPGSYTNTNLTVNAEGQITTAANGSGSGGVTSLNALTGALSITSTGSTITVTPSGSSVDLEGYSLGGTLTSANIVLGTGAGTGASASTVLGTDGNHYIVITTGTSPASSSTIYTLTFTASRGHNTYPVMNNLYYAISSLAQIPFVQFGGSTGYSVSSGSTALSATTNYAFTITAP
jgi:hypothetical protein